jgi:hypothetical protein
MFFFTPTHHSQVDLDDMPHSDIGKINDKIEHYLTEHYGISHLLFRLKLTSVATKAFLFLGSPACTNYLA